jgi:hypothetical protein
MTLLTAVHALRARASLENLHYLRRFKERRICSGEERIGTFGTGLPIQSHMIAPHAAFPLPRAGSSWKCVVAPSNKQVRHAGLPVALLGH